MISPLWFLWMSRGVTRSLRAVRIIPPSELSGITRSQSTLQVLDDRGHAETAAAAGAEEPVLAAPADQLLHREEADPGARGAVRMTEGDGAAVGVPFVHVDLPPRLLFEFLDHRQVLNGKGLVT